MRMLSKQRFRPRRVALSNGFHDGMMATMGSKQQVERSTVAHVVEDDDRRGHEWDEVQAIDEHRQHGGIASRNDDAMKFPVHRSVLPFIIPIEVPLVE